MRFNNFRFNIVFRVLLIVIAVFLFYYSFSTNYFFTPIIVGALIVLLIVSLIRFIDKTNRELASFLESIRFSEFTRTFNLEGMGASFSELNNAFNEVINDFQRVRSEKEEHFYYLQTILQNIDVSVIAYRTDGTIELINKAAKKLFQVSGLRNIQGLESFSSELVKILFKIQPGQNELVRVQDDDDFLQLTIYASNFKIKDKVITLVTIKDIQTVLEEQETEAWQKLIRVLTHEIMNSIAPISSISTTLTSSTSNLPKDKKGNNLLDQESLEEINHALKTINKRSDGLLHFVNTYRNLTKIPQPNFEICRVSNILKNVGNLMSEELKKKEIDLIVKTEPSNLSFTADEQLIEQVLINLVKNAIQALKEQTKAQIKLVSYYNKRGRVTIQVIDNGPGILPDVLEKIFIPFFTTKQNGSGIGLALSRQILKLHNGSITAQSKPNKETVFTLTF
ncbi:MAG TPA: ATP-binding protein [Bacteroidales bacterium]|jgi:two-component system nitrogen regulation sensor histidine kinase NtrY|nr:ATP-binding protein [Bacteroidales bacterium]